jgi:FAM210A/B-like domain
MRMRMKWLNGYNVPRASFHTSARAYQSNNDKKDDQVNGEEEDKKLGIFARGMKKVRSYGYYGIATYAAVDLTFLGGLMVLVYNGFDLTEMLAQFGIDMPQKKGASLFTSWAIAIAANKVTFPFRVVIALYLTPRVKKLWQAYIERRADASERAEHDTGHDDAESTRDVDKK